MQTRSTNVVAIVFSPSVTRRKQAQAWLVKFLLNVLFTFISPHLFLGTMAPYPSPLRLPYTVLVQDKGHKGRNQVVKFSLGFSTDFCTRLMSLRI